MTQTTLQRKVVKALPNGQIIIPSEFREALGIVDEMLLSISLIGAHLELAPLYLSEDAARFSDEDIARILGEYRLDQESTQRDREIRQAEGTLATWLW